MEKTPKAFSDLEIKVGAMIRERYTEALNAELSPEFQKTLGEWMDLEIRHLLVNTGSISKIEIRTHSVVLLFAKKFEKVKELIRIMEEYGLIKDDALFSRLLHLL